MLELEALMNKYDVEITALDIPRDGSNIQICIERGLNIIDNDPWEEVKFGERMTAEKLRTTNATRH